MRRAVVLIFIIFSIFVSRGVIADDTGIDGFNGLFFRPNVDGQGILNVDTANVLIPGVAHVGGITANRALACKLPVRISR